MKQYKEKIQIKDKNGNNIFKQMDYSELVNKIEERTYRMTRFDVVCYLIGYNGVVTETDFENILKAYQDNIID